MQGWLDILQCSNVVLLFSVLAVDSAKYRIDNRLYLLWILLLSVFFDRGCWRNMIRLEMGRWVLTSLSDMSRSMRRHCACHLSRWTTSVMVCSSKKPTWLVCAAKMNFILHSEFVYFKCNLQHSVLKQEVKVIWQKAPHSGPIPRLGVTPGGQKLYHWIPGVGFPISVP